MQLTNFSSSSVIFSGKSKEKLMRKALDSVGYCEEPTTEEALRTCFKDFADSKAFGESLDYNLLDDLDEYSIETIAYNLMKVGGLCK